MPRSTQSPKRSSTGRPTVRSPWTAFRKYAAARLSRSPVRSSSSPVRSSEPGAWRSRTPLRSSWSPGQLPRETRQSSRSPGRSSRSPVRPSRQQTRFSRSKGRSSGPNVDPSRASGRTFKSRGRSTRPRSRSTQSRGRSSRPSGRSSQKRERPSQPRERSSQSRSRSSQPREQSSSRSRGRSSRPRSSRSRGRSSQPRERSSQSRGRSSQPGECSPQSRGRSSQPRERSSQSRGRSSQLRGRSSQSRGQPTVSQRRSSQSPRRSSKSQSRSSQRLGRTSQSSRRSSRSIGRSSRSPDRSSRSPDRSSRSPSPSYREQSFRILSPPRYYPSSPPVQTENYRPIKPSSARSMMEPPICPPLLRRPDPPIKTLQPPVDYHPSTPPRRRKAALLPRRQGPPSPPPAPKIKVAIPSLHCRVFWKTTVMPRRSPYRSVRKVKGSPQAWALYTSAQHRRDSSGSPPPNRLHDPPESWPGSTSSFPPFKKNGKAFLQNSNVYEYHHSDESHQTLFPPIHRRHHRSCSPSRCRPASWHASASSQPSRHYPPLTTTLHNKQQESGPTYLSDGTRTSPSPQPIPPSPSPPQHSEKFHSTSSSNSSRSRQGSEPRGTFSLSAQPSSDRKKTPTAQSLSNRSPEKRVNPTRPTRPKPRSLSPSQRHPASWRTDSFPCSPQRPADRQGMPSSFKTYPDNRSHKPHSTHLDSRSPSPLRRYHASSPSTLPSHSTFKSQQKHSNSRSQSLFQRIFYASPHPSNSPRRKGKPSRRQTAPFPQTISDRPNWKPYSYSHDLSQHHRPSSAPAFYPADPISRRPEIAPLERPPPRLHSDSMQPTVSEYQPRHLPSKMHFAYNKSKRQRPMTQTLKVRSHQRCDDIPICSPSPPATIQGNQQFVSSSLNVPSYRPVDDSRPKSQRKTSWKLMRPAPKSHHLHESIDHQKPWPTAKTSPNHHFPEAHQTHPQPSLRTAGPGRPASWSRSGRSPYPSSAPDHDYPSATYLDYDDPSIIFPDADSRLAFVSDEPTSQILDTRPISGSPYPAIRKVSRPSGTIRSRATIRPAQNQNLQLGSVRESPAVRIITLPPEKSPSTRRRKTMRGRPLTLAPPGSPMAAQPPRDESPEAPSRVPSVDSSVSYSRIMRDRDTTSASVIAMVLDTRLSPTLDK